MRNAGKTLTPQIDTLIRPRPRRSPGRWLMSDKSLGLPRHLNHGVRPWSAIWKILLIYIYERARKATEMAFPSGNQFWRSCATPEPKIRNPGLSRGHGTLCTCWLPVEVDDLARLVTSTPFDPAAIEVATIRRQL